MNGLMNEYQQQNLKKKKEKQIKKLNMVEKPWDLHSE